MGVQQNAFEQWYLKGPSCRRIWIDHNQFPCRTCCKLATAARVPSRDKLDCGDSQWNESRNGSLEIPKLFGSLVFTTYTTTTTSVRPQERKAFNESVEGTAQINYDPPCC